MKKASLIAPKIIGNEMGILPNSVYIRVNTGWDHLVDLNQTPSHNKQLYFVRAVNADGNLVAFDSMPEDSKYNHKDYYGRADMSENPVDGDVTCNIRMDGLVNGVEFVCFDTNDDSMKTTKFGSNTLTVTTKNIAKGVYANYYYSNSNRGLGFITNIKSHTYYNTTKMKNLTQVGCPETGMATINMPAFVDVNLSCYNFYSEYEAETGKFVRSVMKVVQEGASVGSIGRQFCIRTKRDFNTPIVFNYGPHENNENRDHSGGTADIDVMSDRYYVSDTPLFTLEDLQTPTANILFYLFDPDGKYDVDDDIGNEGGGTGGK